MIAVSTNYRKLESGEIPSVLTECATSWQNPVIPMRQWVTVVRGEIERYRAGEYQPQFDVLIRSLKASRLENPTLLDVGASSAFYSEVLRIGGFPCQYTACDYSEAYQRLAAELYPGVPFKIADARALPFADGEFEVVLSGCVILHVDDYERVIAETARVASKFAVFNRTPTYSFSPTQCFEKEAYGVRCHEWHFNQDELLGLFCKYGLEFVSQEDVHFDPENESTNRTYLLRKQ